MGHIRAVIIDDEPKACRLLKLMIEEITDDLIIVNTYNDPSKAVIAIQNDNVDLIFLDIDLPGMSGFDLLDQIPKDFLIVFVTGYDQYALRALRMAAVDYILKPVNISDLTEAINRVRQNLFSRQETNNYDVLIQNFKTQNALHRKIGIPSVMGIDFIRVEDIIYCKGIDKYTKVRTKGDTEILSSYNIGEFVRLIGDSGFFQVHRSYLINLSKIKLYQKDGTLIMDDNSAIPVARRRREEFLKLMNTIHR